jgi:ubiquitin-conjugating enzyme E2 Q
MKSIVKQPRSKKSVVDLTTDELRIDTKVQQAIMKALQEVQKNRECEKFNVHLVDEANMMKWRFTMHNASFLEDAPIIFHDLDEHAVKFRRRPQILFEMLFPVNFPESPPFVRIIYPRFQQYTGHITVGGSICTPILTQGASACCWKPEITISTLILTLHSMLINAMNEEGNSAQAKVQNYAAFPHTNPALEYDEQEAREAYIRAATAHGWSTRSIQLLLK